jgi:hypothetical protein
MAATQSNLGRNAFTYFFDWQSPNPTLGACHCIDLPFVFGNIDVWKTAPMLKGRTCVKSESSVSCIEVRSRPSQRTEIRTVVAFPDGPPTTPIARRCISIVTLRRRSRFERPGQDDVSGLAAHGACYARAGVFEERRRRVIALALDRRAIGLDKDGLHLPRFEVAR